MSAVLTVQRNGFWGMASEGEIYKICIKLYGKESVLIHSQMRYFSRLRKTIKNMYKTYKPKTQ